MPRTDIIVAVLAVLAVVSGWRSGVIARLFAWVGVVAGFLLLPRVLPFVNAVFTPDTLGQRFALNLAASITVVIAAALAGRIVGRIIRFGVRLTPLSLIDRAAGVCLTLFILFVAVSSVLHAAAQFPTGVGDDVRRSFTYQTLDESPFALRSIVNLVPEQVSAGFNPAPSDETASAHARR